MSAGATPSPATEQWSHRELRGLLHAAREELRATEEAMIYGVVAAQVVCRARAVPPCDEEAERRVLGAMVLGRVSRRDVADLDRGDFLGEGHRALFAALIDAHRLERAMGRRARPSARRGDPLALMAACARLRRERVRRLLGADKSALRALERLPWPAASPVEAIATVRALSAWRRRGT